MASLKMAADAVESENLFEVSMGNMAAAARAWSEEVREALGLNAYEVRKQMGTFNVMLMSLGLTEEAAYKMSKGLTALTQDMASFYNLPIEEAFDKIASGIMGQVRPLKSLGIVINDTRLEAFALSHGLIQQGEEMDERTKILARYAFLMEATNKAQGDLGRTLDSPVNQLRIFKEHLHEISIKLGEMLLPIAEKLVKIVYVLTDRLEKSSEATRVAALKWAAVAAVVGPLLILVAALLQSLLAVGTIAGWVGGILLKAVTAIGAVVGALATLTAPQILLALAAIALLIYIIYVSVSKLSGRARESFASWKKDILAWWDGLKKAVSDLKDIKFPGVDYGEEIKMPKIDYGKAEDVKLGKVVGGEGEGMLENLIEATIKKIKALLEEKKKAYENGNAAIERVMEAHQKKIEENLRLEQAAEDKRRGMIGITSLEQQYQGAMIAGLSERVRPPDVDLVEKRKETDVLERQLVEAKATGVKLQELIKLIDARLEPITAGRYQ